MKTPRFLFAIFCWGALAPGLGVAGPANQDSRQAPPASHAPSGADDPSRQAMQNRGKEELAEERHPGQRPGLDKNGEAGAGHVRLRPHRGQNRPKAAAGNREPVPARSSQEHLPGSATRESTGIPQPALNPSAGAASEGLRRHTVEKPSGPALPSVHGQLAGLPVHPAQNRSLAPAVIGGPTGASSSKNPAVINGTGLKHKP